MTDDRLDDLASAHLDGATSPEEVAEVAADPRVPVRVQQLQAIRAAIQAVPPVDPAHREAAVAAALAVFDGATTPVAGSVTSLASVAARRGPSAGSLRLLGAAAAVALLVALVPLLGRLGPSDDDSTATAPNAEDSAGTLGAGDSSVGASETGAEAGGGMSTTTGAAGQRSLGPFESLEALVTAVEDPDGPAAATLDAFPPDGADGEAAACPVQRTEFEEHNAPQQLDRATAIVAGRPVMVLVLTSDTGSRVVTAVLDSDCTPLLERP